MQYQVLVENVGDEMFSAAVLGIPDGIAEGPTEEEALNKATRMLKERLAKGDLFNIEVEDRHLMSLPIHGSRFTAVCVMIRPSRIYD